jgi:anti-sigma B factor antagonist
MDPQLTLTVHRDGPRVILSVGGEVDLATAPQLRAKLLDLVDNRVGSIVVDLTPVPFIDSTGLSALLAEHQRAAARGRTMRLVCPEGPVRRIFRLAGMEMVFPIYSSLAEAVGTQRDDADTAERTAGWPRRPWLSHGE